MRPGIAIVNTFFGTPPFWFPAFLLSCARNPDVRWLIYTDIAADMSLPPNVEFRPTTLTQLNQRASDTLGVRIDVQPQFLKKLCDLKPAYGVIFADDLRPFDFWAHADVDQIWGNVRAFMTDELLRTRDLISARHYKLCGHFTLFRNAAETNRLFERVPDVFDMLSDPRHFRIDERQFTTYLRESLELTPPPPLPRIEWQHDLTMSAKYQRALEDSPTGNLWWRNGRTFGTEGKELMYLHFNKLKKYMHSINFGVGDDPPAFAINRTGIVA